MPQGDGPVAAAARVARLLRGGALTAAIALCVLSQARAQGIEAAVLHVESAQLAWMALLPITACLLAGVQLPSEQVLLLCQCILCQALV